MFSRMSKSNSLSSLPDWPKLILLFELVPFRHEECTSEFKKIDYNIYITINKGEQIYAKWKKKRTTGSMINRKIV